MSESIKLDPNAIEGAIIVPKAFGSPLEEIKKSLYRNNPTAVFLYAKKGHLYYEAIWDGMIRTKKVSFMVPFEDIGDAVFNSEMPAKLLIRYIVLPQNGI